MTILKTCPCGETFVPKTSRQKYCSPQCRERFKKQKQRLERKLKGLCPHCGKPMDYPVSTWRTKRKISYCSRCREYYRKRYKKAKVSLNLTTKLAES